ncbi:MAG: patatin-like phospholipase family protein [Proteobacteria bacterium]|nr:patatin-like phospholipase family protein [Pseudomonadota bacterium]
MALAAGGCLSFNPANQPLERVDPDRGYRSEKNEIYRERSELWIILAFSGGGTRAAAFAYGVMEELRATRVVIDGESISLLDEVDTISAVSGGSFPAAYYGLFGDRIFEDFEERFLRKNVQGALFLRALHPWNLVRLMTPLLSRTDLASRYYDKHIFEGSTFADLVEAKAPRIHINATDLTRGNRFTFTQGGFDLICSDLDPFPISSAVAASSAVPVLLSPLTLENYGGGCGFEVPDWFSRALQSRATHPRRYEVARSIDQYLEPDAKRYIHLVDGGISDNLGLRLPIERTALLGKKLQKKIFDIEPPRQLVIIAVNAAVDPDPAIDLSYAAPSLAMSLNLSSGAQIRRYNFETLELARTAVDDWTQEFSQDTDEPVTGHFIEVSFDLLPDEEDRRYFNRLPTSFKLSDEQVDRLRDAGRTILRNSAEFQELLGELR